MIGLEKQPIGRENSNKRQIIGLEKQPVGLENRNKRQIIGLGIRNTR